MLLTKIILDNIGVYKNSNEFDLETTPQKPIILYGGFGRSEQGLLELVCNDYKIPYKLVSNLLNSELELQGGSGHAKIFEKIKKELSKEWRDDIDTIRKELFTQRDEETQVRPNAFN